MSECQDTRLEVRCVNAHDRCDGGACEWCEYVWPLRWSASGRFAPSHAAVGIADECGTIIRDPDRPTRTTNPTEGAGHD